ncbi:MAG TPA: hypothetical protein VMU67_14545 [Steroidobacteraceae bacterium]|nr:hypothetical protein [Steroidobacteraceae bacterium]
MSANLLQGIAAALIVLASALYAGWRLATPRARMKLIGWLAAPPAGARSEAGGGVPRSWRIRLRAALAPRAAGGCHDCAAGAPKPPRQHRTRS